MPKEGKVKQKKDLLFDCVLIIELHQGASGAIEPFASYRFPKVEGDDKFSKSIIQFCFPDISDFPKETMESETFSFCLTEADGDRRFGYCLRVLPRGAGLRLPLCFCILSFYPCYSMFSGVLEQISSRYYVSSTSITQFLTSLLTKRFPSPGETFTVTIDQAEHKFTRPDDNDYQLDYVNLEPLLTRVEPINILKIFASLLVERRVIFSSSKLSTLSSCVQASIALLYPLNWQHIYIPVLPKSLLTFCCAPMPFVVGILESFLPEVGQLPMEQVLIVDLDEDVFLRTPSDEFDYKLIPTTLTSPLLKTLNLVCKAAKKNRKKRKKDSTDPQDFTESKRILTDAFVAFFVDVLASYRNYITTTGFNREAFIQSQPQEAGEFLDLFMSSQMFERFIEERAGRGNHQQSNNGVFESRVTLYNNLNTKLFPQIAANASYPDTASAAGGRHWTLYEENYLQKKETPRQEEKKSFTDYFKARMGALTTKSPSVPYIPGKSFSGIVSSGDDFEIEAPLKTKPSRIISTNNLSPITTTTSPTPPMTAPRKHATLNSRSLANINDRQRSKTSESVDDLVIGVRKSQKVQATMISSALKQKQTDDLLPLSARSADPRKSPEASVKQVVKGSTTISPTLTATTPAPGLSQIRPFSGKMIPLEAKTTLRAVEARGSGISNRPDARKISSKDSTLVEPDNFARRHKRRSSLSDINEIPLPDFAHLAVAKTRVSAKLKGGSHIGVTSNPASSADALPVESKPPSRPPPPPPVRPPVRPASKFCLPKRTLSKNPQMATASAEDQKPPVHVPQQWATSPVLKLVASSNKQSPQLSRIGKQEFSPERKLSLDATLAKPPTNEGRPLPNPSLGSSGEKLRTTKSPSNEGRPLPNPTTTTTTTERSKPSANERRPLPNPMISDKSTKFASEACLVRSHTEPKEKKGGSLVSQGRPLPQPSSSFPSPKITTSAITPPLVHNRQNSSEGTRPLPTTPTNDASHRLPRHTKN